MVNKIKNIINIFIADDNILKPKGFIITLIREYLSENQREKAVLVAFYFLLLVYPVVVLSIFLIGKIPSLEVIDISNFLDAVNSPLLKDLYEHASLLSDSDLKFSLIIILLIFGSTAFQYIIDYSDFLFKVKKKKKLYHASNYFKFNDASSFDDSYSL